MLTYTQAKAAVDVSLVVETSTDLAAWQNGPAFIEAVSAVDEGTVRRITVRLVAPASAGTKSFVRLRVFRL